MKILPLGIAIIMGSIVGAGILGIPYTVIQSGFLIGALEIILLGIVIALFYLYLGEVTLRLKGTHELTGYAEKFLGKYGKYGFAFSMAFGIYGALIAYLFGIGEAVTNLVGGTTLYYSLAAFVILGFFVHKGLKLIENIEFWMIGGVVLIVVIIALFSFSVIDYNNYKGVNLSNAFVPYGAILFAFIGASVIPEVRQVLNKNKNLMKKSIIYAVVIITLIYLLFAFIVVGATGKNTTEIATTGLGNQVSPVMLILGNVFAIFTMSTSFLALGLALRWMFEYDYKVKKNLALFLVLFIPLIFVLFHIGSFVKIISLAGIVTGGLEGILILMMHYKAKKLGERKPEYTIEGNFAIYAIILILFLAGIIMSLKGYF